MKRLIVSLRDKTQVYRLEEFSHVIYVSKFLNTVGIEIRDDAVCHLEKDDNVLSFRESEQGQFQPMGSCCG
jgi:hypothetical protein